MFPLQVQTLELKWPNFKKKFVKFIYPRTHLQVHENVRTNINRGVGWGQEQNCFPSLRESPQESRRKASCLSCWGTTGPITTIFLHPVRTWENHLAPRHPPDAYLQHRAIVKVVGTGSPLQRGEGHVAPGERGNVTELVGAQGLLLVLASPDEAAVHLEVGVLTGAAVVLVRNPGPVLPRALVNGEALGPAGVEPEAHVCDVKRFSYGTNTLKFISHV